MPISPDGIENVSLSGSGAAGDAHSIGVTAMSADGRYVVFTSHADNLVDGSSSGFQQVFRKDMLTGEVVLVSSSADGVVGVGASDNPSITGDGRYVVFDSAAGNLVAGDTGGHRDIFLKDCLTGAVTRISELGGAGGDGQSMQAAISADGNYVVFTSVASNLTGEGNGEYQILLWDRSDGSFKPLSLATDDGLGNGLSRAPDISGDGRFVVFQSQASNLSNLDDSSFYTDIFLWDRTTDDLTLVSTGPTHQSASSYGPYISDDGAVVSFYSDATNLVAGPDTNAAADAFVYYTSGGSIVRVSETADGQIGSGSSIAGSVSNETSEGDRYVILRSGSANFPDSSGIFQVFAKNLTTGELTNISQGYSAGGGSVSQDGRFFTFFGDIDGLLGDDTNGFADIFQLGHDGVLDATISVSADQPSVTEGNSGITDYTFTLTRGGELIGESSVDYAVTGTGANAADAGDFAGGAFPGGTLTFGYGQTELTLTIGIAGDTIVEPDEGFIVTLSNPDNAAIGTGTASGIIANDDGGGGGAAPVALDLDIGSIGSGVDLVVNVADIVTELAFDADTDLSAADISFTAATIDGVPITFADLGFDYSAGLGDDGSFSISTEGAAAFAHLLEGESVDVVVTFTVSDGTSTDIGELIYTVVGSDLSYDATLDFLGATVADEEIVAESVAGAGETKLDIAVTGSITLEGIFAALDLTAAAGDAVEDVLTDPALTVAAAVASNDSTATATAADQSQAGAFATDGSTASAGAADGRMPSPPPTIRASRPRQRPTARLRTRRRTTQAMRRPPPPMVPMRRPSPATIRNPRPPQPIRRRRRPSPTTKAKPRPRPRPTPTPRRSGRSCPMRRRPPSPIPHRLPRPMATPSPARSPPTIPSPWRMRIPAARAKRLRSTAAWRPPAVRTPATRSRGRRVIPLPPPPPMPAAMPAQLRMTARRRKPPRRMLPTLRQLRHQLRWRPPPPMTAPALSRRRTSLPPRSHSRRRTRSPRPLPNRAASPARWPRTPPRRRPPRPTVRMRSLPVSTAATPSPPLRTVRRRAHPPRTIALPVS